MIIMTLVLSGCSINVSNNILDKNNNENLKNTILSVQNSDGGFGSIPSGAIRTPDLYSTYYSLKSLSELSKLSLIDNNKEKTVNWLQSLEPVNLVDNYYIVLSLQILKKQPTKKSRIIAFINNCANQNGSYSGNNQKESTSDELVFSTFEAVSVFNALDEPVKNITKDWLKQTWDNRNTLNIVAKEQLLNCLKMTGSNPEISNDDKNFAKEALNSPTSIAEITSALQFNSTIDKEYICNKLENIKTNGGFSFVIPAENTDIQGIYYALHIYNLMSINSSKTGEIINYILTKESEKGGFFVDYHTGSLGITTFYAIYILQNLGITKLLDTDKYIQNSIIKEKQVNYLYPLILTVQKDKVPVKINQDILTSLINKIELLNIKSGEDIRDLFFSLYILDYSDEKISDELKIKIKKELDALQIENGSFKIENSNIISTYYAVKCYELIKQEIPFKEKTILWLKQLQSSNGTFQMANTDPDIVFNYLVIDLLHDFNIQPLYKDKLRNWLISCKKENGLFQMAPGDTIQKDTDPLLSTFSAYYIMNILGT